MNFPSVLSIVVASLNLLVALIFGIVVQANVQVALRRGRLAPPILVATLVCAGLSMIFVLSAVFALTPGTLHFSMPPVLRVLYTLSDVLTFATVAVFAHMVQLLAVREDGPSRRWLRWNYGTAALMIALDVLMHDVQREAPGLRTAVEVAKWSYLLGVAVLTARQLRRLAGRGGWRPGLMGAASRSDFWALVAACACLGATVLLHLDGSWATHRGALSLLGALIGLAMAAPFVARNLGVVLSGLLSALGLLTATALSLFVGIRLGDLLPTETRLFAPLATILLLLLALGPGQPALLAVVERIVFRRSRLRREELAHFLRSLSPDLGPQECSLRAMRELRRVLRLRGVALVFRDGGAVGVGDIDADALARAWPVGPAADVLLDRPRFGDDQAGLPWVVRQALGRHDVLGIVAVRGSKRLWGHLLLRPDLVATVYRDEGTVTVEIFADQLAVLLDAASLLDRAVEMERSLAHSEKLAAMGELAARIAHDIRNPITAARSLAQQLAAEAGSDADVHEVIVEELERVERHVADLLRFSRRDELDRQGVDLSALVHETVSRLRSRLEGADVQVSIRGPAELRVSADRERIRHVLINLIENAADAVSADGRAGRIAISLERKDGVARVAVRDDGPGIPEDALETVFEPFVSSKPKGTGLGLAIVKRTVEAHGGRVVATSDGSGACFVVELPDESAQPDRPVDAVPQPAMRGNP